MNLQTLIHRLYSSDPVIREIKLVPLLVGSVSSSKMGRYAEILSEYWKDPETFWVISSDFCHWQVTELVV